MSASDGSPSNERLRLIELPPLREVVRRHQLDAKKSLGQNFLFDLNLTDRIARAAGPLDGVVVVEIGPGPGGLTRSLLTAGAARVVAIERDERCLAALAEIEDHCRGRLEIVSGDALSMDYKALANAIGGDKPIRLIANLPYNIAVPLLIGWLETNPWPPWFDRMVLMFQREVAERIVATPATRADYGRLSVLCSWRAEARILFDVPPSAFTPAPKVTSSVVELIPRAQPMECDPAALEAVARAAFGQRRKMLRQSLRSLNGLGWRIDASRLLSDTGLDATLRAEQLEISDFVALARRLPPISDASRDASRVPNPDPNLDPNTEPR